MRGSFFNRNDLLSRPPISCSLNLKTNVSTNLPGSMTFVSPLQVILVSSSQLLLKERQKAECDVHACDRLTLFDLGRILFLRSRSEL